MVLPLGDLLPLVNTSQSPVPEGLSSSHTDRWERRCTTLVNPREDTGKSSSKNSCVEDVCVWVEDVCVWVEEVCVCVEDVYMWRVRVWGGLSVEGVWVWRVYGCRGSVCVDVEVCVRVCESLCAYTWKHLLMRNGIDVCVGGK